jgi:hypothetical protein
MATNQFLSNVQCTAAEKLVGGHATLYLLSNQFLSSGALDVEATALLYRQCV